MNDQSHRGQERRVYIPDTLGELRQLLGHHPDAQIVSAGSVLVGSHGGRDIDQARPVIALHRLAELRRLTRSQNALDVGAGVTVAQLLNATSGFLPAPLVEALHAVGSPQQRTLTTLGGIVATSRMITAPLLALVVLDARVELRRRNETDWYPITRLRHANGALNFRSAEILSRVRIPLVKPSIWLLHLFDAYQDCANRTVGFCGLATIEGERIVAMRLAVAHPADGGVRIVRDRAVETNLEGGKPTIEERGRLVAQTRITAGLDPARYPLEHQRIAGALERFFDLVGRGS